LAWLAVLALGLGLNAMPALHDSATKLATICGAPISSVPTLADFIAGRNIPIVLARQVGTRPKPAAAPIYIGAYDLVDGKDFVAVMRRVGDKIELVGQIVSVKQGIGSRGRGRGRPYVFINFGIWNKDSVKITIWSEGLSNMSRRPTETWVGKWISVTGLIEPPYEGKHYGRPYRSVGISVTLDSQIVELSEQEAKFRLGRAAGPAPPPPAGSNSSNKEILKRVVGHHPAGGRGGRQPAAVVTTPPTPRAPPHSTGPSPSTRNKKILEGLQTSQRTAIPSWSPQSTITRSPRPYKPGLLARIPRWIWAIVAMVIIFLLSVGR
jgi:hypothetical protein